MKGFFSKEQTQTKGQIKGFSCASCGLYKYALTPKMQPYGNFKKGIMVIGEAPGEDEDRRGKPWQGKMGRVLRRKYKELGIDLFDLHQLKCECRPRQKGNRTPTDREIACCFPKVIQAIRKYQPKVIILQGGAPTQSLIGSKWKGDFGGIMKWRGWTIPDREYNAWICPTFHPSFIERQDGESEADVIWTQDLKNAFEKVDSIFPNLKNEEDAVIITDDFEGVMAEMNQPGAMAFDIETTGLKPYDKKHKIITISFCNELNKAYATPFPTKKKHLRLLKELLENPKVEKVAANMKYEDNWMNVLHGISVYPGI